MRFDRSASKHRVPRRSTWYVVMTATPRPIITNRGEPGLWYVGIDDRGVELEVCTVKRGAEEMVIHSMPTSYRHSAEGGQ